MGFIGSLVKDLESGATDWVQRRIAQMDQPGQDVDYLSGVSPSTARIDYRIHGELWQGYDNSVLALARAEGVNAVAELGGGANPTIGDDERWGFAEHRVVYDISATELAKAQSKVEMRVADLCKPIDEGWNSYDLVFSKMLCEHLPDPRVFHENCFKLLRPGGLSVHYFPTRGTFPFFVNRLIPENFAHTVLRAVAPGRLAMDNLQKFPAHYRWTTGPTRRGIERFENLGFEIEQWHSAFGHHYYFVIPPLEALEHKKSELLLRHPAPGLTSYAVVVLRKPAIKS